MDKLRGFNSKLRSHLVYLMTEYAYAPDKKSYLQKYDLLVKEGGRRVIDFLEGIPIQNWCNAFFWGQRYGEMSFSLAESWNKMIDEARYMPISSIIDVIRIKTMKDIAYMRLL